MAFEIINIILQIFYRISRILVENDLCKISRNRCKIDGEIAFHARGRGSFPGLGGLKETKMFSPHPLVKLSIVGSLRDREVACLASDFQGLNFESCVWSAVSSHSSHHPFISFLNYLTFFPSLELQAMEKSLNSWHRRNITILRRVTIVSSLQS